jgi:hypothetical protein
MPQPKIYESRAQRQAAYRKRCQDARHRQLQAKGLPELPAISTMPGTVRWNQALAHACHLLSLIEQEMQAYYDDRSEAWLESERADQFQERLEAVSQALQYVEELCAG